eukprot:2630828-Amphidinium_carterae.1
MYYRGVRSSQVDPACSRHDNEDELKILQGPEGISMPLLFNISFQFRLKTEFSGNCKLRPRSHNK